MFEFNCIFYYILNLLEKLSIRLHMVLQAFINTLANDEFYSPIAFIACGVLTLMLASALKSFSMRQAQSRPHPSGRRLDSLIHRFENRTRTSWVLIGFGLLWLAQLVVERASAAR